VLGSDEIICKYLPL